MSQCGFVYLHVVVGLWSSSDSAARWEVHFSNPSETSSATSSVALGLPAILGDPKGIKGAVQLSLVQLIQFSSGLFYCLM